MEKVAMYKEMIYKEAEADEQDRKKTLKDVAGSGAIVGGGLLARDTINKGHLTGREMLFHNTDKENVKSILNRGILASKGAKDGTISSALADIPAEELKGKTYLARKKLVAFDAGIARAKNKMMRDGEWAPFDILGRNEAKALEMARRDSKTLKARVPSWKLKTVANPELRGAKTLEEYREIFDKIPGVQSMPEKRKQILSQYLFNELGEGTVTVQGGISPRYIKGSKYYKGANLKEVIEFAKKNPQRFAKGVALAGTGAAAMGLGAKMIYDNNKKKKQEKAASYKEAIYKEAIYKEAGLLGGLTGGAFGGMLLGHAVGSGLAKLTTPYNPEIKKIHSQERGLHKATRDFRATNKVVDLNAIADEIPELLSQELAKTPTKEMSTQQVEDLAEKIFKNRFLEEHQKLTKTAKLKLKPSTWVGLALSSIPTGSHVGKEAYKHEKSRRTNIDMARRQLESAQRFYDGQKTLASGRLPDDTYINAMGGSHHGVFHPAGLIKDVHTVACEDREYYGEMLDGYLKSHGVDPKKMKWTDYQLLAKKLNRALTYEDTSDSIRIDHHPSQELARIKSGKNPAPVEYGNDKYYEQFEGLLRKKQK